MIDAMKVLVHDAPIVGTTVTEVNRCRNRWRIVLPCISGCNNRRRDNQV